LNYLGIIETENGLNNDLFEDYGSSSFENYKDRADKKNLDFELSFKEFMLVKSLSCYLCGKESSINHMNGIDRLNNDDGYDIRNIQPCCASCNYMKNKYDIHDFIRKIYTIYVKKYTPEQIFLDKELDDMIDDTININMSFLFADFALCNKEE
jgi:hypothetical protein